MYWQRPETWNFTLNTDGSFNNGNGKAGLGGALRDDQGDLIMDYSVPIQCNSHNLAEAQGAWFRPNKCVQDGFSNFIVELDSLLVNNMLREGKANS